MDDEIIIGINRKEPPKKSKKTKKKKKTVKASVKKEAKMGKGSAGKKQSKKGNSNNTVIVKIVLAIIVFVAIIIGLSNVPLFNIKNIEVVGNTKLSEDKITYTVKASGGKIETNLLFYKFYIVNS